MDLKNILKTIRLSESTISMVLGVIVIIVVGVLAVNYLSGQRPSTLPPVDITNVSPTGAGLPTKHTVSENESLWTISEKYYGTGYNWVDIRDANNLANPNQIVLGTELTIPDVAVRMPEETASPTIVAQVSPTATQTVTPTQTPSITKSEDDLSVTPTPIPTVTPTLVPQVSGEHKVAAGDSLWTISEKYYGTGYEWTKIAKENNLTNPSKIEVGQSLKVPTATQTATDLPTNTQTYTVQKGDTLWSIAQSQLGDPYLWTEIAKLNKLEHPSLIHTGNTLTMPTK